MAALAVSVAGCEPPPRVDLAIVEVAVVDPETGTVTPDRTLWIDEGRIRAIRPSGAGSELAARVERHQGRYVIPGLWDLHVHALWDSEVAADFLPRFTRAGVTGIRDMGGTAEVLAQVRAGNEPLWPRIVAAGPVIDGPEPVDPTISLAVADAAGGRAAVARLRELGADFVKPYTLLPREAFFAVAEAAREAEMPLAGHVPGAVTVIEAIAAGLRSIEHLRDGLGGLCAELDPAVCEDLIQRLAAGGVHVTPTLVVLRAKSVPGYLADEERPDLEALPAAVADYWRSSSAAHAQRGAAYFEERRLLYDERTATLRRLRLAGVPILAGTDAGTVFVMPGTGLHRELAALVDAGLTPREALYSATLGAARFLRLEDTGAVRPGFAADLVVLDGNPLDDISAVGEVAGVVRAGRWIDRGEP